MPANVPVSVFSPFLAIEIPLVRQAHWSITQQAAPLIVACGWLSYLYARKTQKLYQTAALDEPIALGSITQLLTGVSIL
jgi:hypothetical protein